MYSEAHVQLLDINKSVQIKHLSQHYQCLEIQKQTQLSLTFSQLWHVW